MIRRPDIKPPLPMCRDIFSVGACVRVDTSSTSQGGIGFVTVVYTEERKVDVNYNENSIGLVNFSSFITEARLHPHVYAPSDGGTTRSGRRRIEFGEAATTAVVLTPPPSGVNMIEQKLPICMSIIIKW